MTAIFISTLHNLGSLALGFCAWGLGICAIRSRRSRSAYGFSFGSFCACAVSLVLQLLEVQNRVRIRDFAAIEDTIRAVILAACVLLSVTVFLNTAALIKAAKKPI